MIAPVVLLLAARAHASAAFQVPSRHLSPPALLRCPTAPSASKTRRRRAVVPTSLRGLFDDDDEADEIVIPPELRDEIYAAEANAPAAQGRQQRIVVYVLLTIFGATAAFFNAFLTDLRFGDGSPSSDLAYYGFGWVQDNFLTSFAFTNKIGGGIALLGAGLSGTLAEVEIRSKKENAEKIWLEMQRRKSLKEKPAKSKKGKKRRSSSAPSSRNRKDMTGRQKKRLSALEELMEDDDNNTEVEVAAAESADNPESNAATTAAQDKPKEGSEKADGGILGSIKGFYEKADSMAASQALLLNKELEDRGIVDKITDESGLKVIGKEEASKSADRQKNGE